MGEENKQKVFSIGNKDLSEYYFADGPDGGNKICGFNGGSVTCRITIPKSMRCKSIKRFVKLLMAKGIPRNMAVKMAKLKPENESYDFIWFWIRLMCVGGL